MYLRVKPGKVEDVVAQIQASKGVRHAVTVVGDWDVLAAVHGPDLDEHRRRRAALHPPDRRRRADAHGAGRPGRRDGARRRRARRDRSRCTACPRRCFVRIRTTPDATTHIFEALAEMDDVAGRRADRRRGRHPRRGAGRVGRGGACRARADRRDPGRRVDEHPRRRPGSARATTTAARSRPGAEPRRVRPRSGGAPPRRAPLRRRRRRATRATRASARRAIPARSRPT